MDNYTKETKHIINTHFTTAHDIETKHNNYDFKNQFYEDLSYCIDKIKQLDIKNVKSFISNNLKKEREDIIKDFHNSFDKVPDNDVLKIKVLLLLGTMGIIIYKKSQMDSS